MIAINTEIIYRGDVEVNIDPDEFEADMGMADCISPVPRLKAGISISRDSLEDFVDESASVVGSLDEAARKSVLKFLRKVLKKLPEKVTEIRFVKEGSN